MPVVVCVTVKWPVLKRLNENIFVKAAKAKQI
jgi:hypothetical protein